MQVRLIPVPSKHKTTFSSIMSTSSDLLRNGDQSIPIPISNNDLFDTRGLVAGAWKNGAGDKSFPVYEPSSGKVLRQCADLDRQDFIDAIDAADEGYREFWASTTAKQRGALLRRWHDLILENVEDCKLIDHMHGQYSRTNQVSEHYTVLGKWQDPCRGPGRGENGCNVCLVVRRGGHQVIR